MQALRSRPGVRRGGILYLRADELSPNPVQPRRRFDDEALAELSESIKTYGILNPLTVRLRGGKYELVAGERRLRAAKLAGLQEVPCILLDVNMEDASLIALVENLQRRDLDPFEEAEGLLRLTRDFGLTQQQAAQQIGKTQAAVANKLRLLRLFPETIDIIRQNHLTERHGRALLALEEETAQVEAARYIAGHQLNVAQAEAYIERCRASPQTRPNPKKQVFLKDVRFFINSVTRAVDSVRSAGLEATCTQTTEDGNLLLTIVIPKAMK